MRISRRELDEICFAINFHILENESAKRNDMFELIFTVMKSQGHTDVDISEFMGVSKMFVHRFKKMRDEPLFHHPV